MLVKDSKERGLVTMLPVFMMGPECYPKRCHNAAIIWWVNTKSSTQCFKISLENSQNYGNQWYCFSLFLPSLLFFFKKNLGVSFTNIGHFEQSETSLRFASAIHSIITTQILVDSNSHWHFQSNMAAEESQCSNGVEQVGNTIFL